jgi:hypothetical protein
MVCESRGLILNEEILSSGIRASSDWINLPAAAYAALRKTFYSPEKKMD